MKLKREKQGTRRTQKAEKQSTSRTQLTVRRCQVGACPCLASRRASSTVFLPVVSSRYRAEASFTAASAILIGFKLFKLAATAVKPVAYCVTWLNSLVICLLSLLCL